MDLPTLGANHYRTTVALQHLALVVHAFLVDGKQPRRGEVVRHTRQGEVVRHTLHDTIASWHADVLPSRVQFTPASDCGFQGSELRLSHVDPFC